MGIGKHCWGLQGLLTAMLLAALCGCNSQPSSGTAVPTTHEASPAVPPSDPLDASKPLDYIKSAPLQFSELNKPLVWNNSQTLAGRGAKSRYRIRYTFQSGAATRFVLLQARHQLTGCFAAHSEAITLNHDGKRESIAALQNQVLTPNANYTLEVEQTQACDAFQMVYNLVAWMGADSEVNPSAGVRCVDDDGLVYGLFVASNSIIRGGEGRAFASVNEYCGRSTILEEGKCQSDTRADSDLELSFGCQASLGRMDLSFTVAIASATQSGDLVCKANDVESVRKYLSLCKPMVYDLNHVEL